MTQTAPASTHDARTPSLGSPRRRPRVPHILRVFASLAANVAGAVAVVAASGCVEPAVLLADDGRVSIAPLVDDGGILRGISRDPSSGSLHVLVEGQGLLEVDDDGTLLATRPLGDNGLTALPYRDLAALGDGRFLLIADNEGYLWDEVTAQHRVHFCVEPGFVECFDENGNLIDENNNGICDWEEVEPGPEPTPVIQRNDALALVGGEVVAAPRFYEAGVRVESTLRTYNVVDGTSTGAVDLSAIPQDFAGLAAADGALFGVGGDAMVRFALDGTPEVTGVLEGINDAAGLTVDGDHLLVLDGERLEMVRYETPEG